MDEQALETDNFIRYNNLLPKNMQLLSLDCPQASNMEKECVISASTNHSSSQILPIRILTSAKTGFGVETLVQWLQNCHQEPSH